MNVMTVVRFDDTEHDRLLSLSYPDDGSVIDVAVHRIVMIALEVVPGKATLRMSYYPIKGDGGAGRSIRFWHRDLPDRAGHHDRWLRLIIGPDATAVVVMALAAMWNEEQVS